MLSALNAAPGALELRIRLPERFVFAFHREFRGAYHHVSSADYILDMRDTEYMDSSALGMLLQLYEHAGATGGAIRIVNARAKVRTILRIANFDKLMVVE